MAAPDARPAASQRLHRRCREDRHIIEIDRFVLTTACAQLAAWRREPGKEHLSMNVNMSAVEVRDGSLNTTVREALEEAILKAAVAFGKTLGLFVILEGIETPEQYEAGTRVGADAAQGYFMSRPLPADEITPMLAVPRVPVGSNA
jgi:EAL domain-containing protein (putative c-di-GMP-specific phosphodiesterase class I)